MKAPFKFRWRGEERRGGGGVGGGGGASEDEEGAGAPADTHFNDFAATVCQRPIWEPPEPPGSPPELMLSLWRRSGDALAINFGRMYPRKGWGGVG